MQRLLFTASVFLLIASGCGRPVTSASQYGAFDSYVENFKAEASRQQVATSHKPLRFEVGSLPTGKVGLCTSEFDSALITIDPTAWAKMSSARKEALVFHELGHCLLNRPHDDKWVGDEHRPSSVMNTFLLSGIVYSEHRQTFLNELFGNSDSLVVLNGPEDRTSLDLSRAFDAPESELNLSID